MAGMSFVCPSCEARVRSPREIPDGTQVKCPGCGHVFRLGATADSLTVEAPQPRTRPTRPADDDQDERPRVRSRVRDDDEDDRPRSRSGVRSRDDDEDDDDRPVRKKERPKKKKGSLLGRLVFLGVFLMILIGVVGGVAGYAWYSVTNVHENRIASQGPGSGPGAPPRFELSGQNGFGGEFVTEGLKLPPGGDAGPLTRHADAILTEASLAIGRPRRLIGPAPASTKTPATEAGATIPLPVIGKVKKATTMIVVRTGDGRSGSGSGFFVGRDLVMTNAHVVGMLGVNAAKPQRIDIVLNSGEADEAVCKGEIVAIDRENDLALLRASQPPRHVPYPEPLVIGASANLFETQPVWVFGYPLGEQLGKTVTVGPTTVTSLRRDPAGVLERVQVAAAMEHGNSGGPVVDAAGAVIGVSVAIIKETRISFAVAAERVTALLEGRLTSLTAGATEKRGNGYQLPVTIAFHDALKKIQSASVDWWWGEPGDTVPTARGTAKQPAAGRQRVELKRGSDGTYTGTMTVGSKLPAGKVLWLQARHVDSNKTELAYQGIAIEVNPAAEERPVTLSYRPRGGEGKLAVRSNTTTRFETQEHGVHSIQFNLSGLTREQTLGQEDERDHWVYRINFDKLDAGLLVDDKPLDRSLSVLDFAPHVSKARVDLKAERNGEITAARTNLQDVPPEPQRVLSGFVLQLARAVQLASVGCPQGQLSPGKSWTNKRSVSVILPGSNIQVDVELRYTYEGIRLLEGREMAELRVSGQPLDSPDVTEVPKGTVHGRVLIDVATGLVAKADLGIDMTINNVLFASESGAANASIEVKLQRE